MKIIVYIRVSTETQARDGFGKADQEKQCRRWIKANGHKLVRVVFDDAKSGTLPAEERPGLLECLKAVRSGEAEGILMRDLDRIARVLTTQEAVLAQIWSLGGSVFVSTDANEIPRDDPEDPMRTAMRQMAGVFAQLERAMVVKRLRNGRKTKAEQGGFAYGSPAFGQRADGKALVPDDREAAGVQRIMELHQEGKSLREIISILDAEGIKPKREGSSWHPSTVRRVINRHS